MLVWLDDRLVPADEAHVSVYDRGFRSGEGIFETFRAYAGWPFRLEAHLERAAAGARVLGFELPARSHLVRALRRTAEVNHDGDDLALRLTVTAGQVDPDSPFPGRPAGAPTTVVTAHRLRIDPSAYEVGVRGALIARAREVPDVKAVSYLASSLARREAVARGADEALLVGPDGTLLEGSYSNIFLVRQRFLLTPPVEAGILPGVTRAVVVELAVGTGLEVREQRLTADDLRAADEAFLTATTREVVPLVEVDDQRVGTGEPGPVTRALHRAYREEVAREAAAAREAGAAQD